MAADTPKEPTSKKAADQDTSGNVFDPEEMIANQPAPPDRLKGGGIGVPAKGDSSKKDIYAVWPGALAEQRKSLEDTVQDRDAVRNELRSVLTKDFSSQHPEATAEEIADNVESHMESHRNQDQAKPGNYANNSPDHVYPEIGKLDKEASHREWIATSEGTSLARRQTSRAAQEMIDTNKKINIANGMPALEASQAARDSFIEHWNTLHGEDSSLPAWLAIHLRTV